MTTNIMTRYDNSWNLNECMELKNPLISFHFFASAFCRSHEDNE